MPAPRRLVSGRPNVAPSFVSQVRAGAAGVARFFQHNKIKPLFLQFFQKTANILLTTARYARRMPRLLKNQPGSADFRRREMGFTHGFAEVLVLPRCSLRGFSPQAPCEYV